MIPNFRPDSRFARQRGFTLIEILVVMVIIGIVVVGAILSLGATGRDSQLERERDRLSALFAYVHERGAMLTLEYGLRCGQHGYRFVYFDNITNRWVPEDVDDTLRARRLPAGLSLTLSIEGRPIVLTDKALTVDPHAAAAALSPGSTVSQLGSDMPSSFNNQLADNSPQIMLFSNGDTNVFALTITRDGVRRNVTLQSAPDGSVHVGDVLEGKR
ncbi:MAG TPA: type II secretion system minor pseudopilin GspH [Steroidobacteraceae bacterium]